MELVTLENESETFFRSMKLFPIEIEDLVLLYFRAENVKLLRLLSKLRAKGLDEILAQDPEGKETQEQFIVLQNKYSDAKQAYFNQEQEIIGGIQSKDFYYESLLGSMYATGEILEMENPWRAVKWLLFACLQGYVPAMVHLTDILETNSVFQKDENVAQNLRSYINQFLERSVLASG